MQNWSRLILPLGLALLAAGINAGVMHTRLAFTELVAVNRPIQPGEKFLETDLVKVEVGYPSAALKNHFFTWENRAALLNEVGSRVALTPGDLVPIVQFRSYQLATFQIPSDHLEMGFRVHETSVASAHRRLLVPGRRVRLDFAEPGRFVEATLAYIDASKAGKGDESKGLYYQVGVFLPRDANPGDIQLLATKNVSQVLGLADGI